MPPPPTARLTFRSWTPADEPLALALWADPRVMEMIDVRAAAPDIARARLADEIERERVHGVQYWPLFETATGAHVGCCGLRPHTTPTACELGFHLRHEHWGKGYATEAGRGVIEYAFEALHLTELIAGHHPQNESSRKTLEKLGFRYSHHQFYPPTGKEHPYYILERADCPEISR